MYTYICIFLCQGVRWETTYKISKFIHYICIYTEIVPQQSAPPTNHAKFPEVPRNSMAPVGPGLRPLDPKNKPLVVHWWSPGVDTLKGFNRRFIVEYFISPEKSEKATLRKPWEFPRLQVNKSPNPDWCFQNTLRTCPALIPSQV